MAVLGKIAKFVLGGGLVGALLGSGKKAEPAAAVQPLATPMRDDAELVARRENLMRRRRGAASDMIVNGSAGAEASTGGPRLVVGN